MTPESLYHSKDLNVNFLCRLETQENFIGTICQESLKP